MVKLSETLAGFVVARHWLEEARAQRDRAGGVREGDRDARRDLAIVAEVSPLVRHLRESGQLTAGLVLRALLSGNVTLFEQALAELAGMPAARVSALVHDRRGAGFKAVYDRAGLPAPVYPAFRAAHRGDARETASSAEPGGERGCKPPDGGARADELRGASRAGQSSR